MLFHYVSYFLHARENVELRSYCPIQVMFDFIFLSELQVENELDPINQASFDELEKTLGEKK